MIMLLRTLTGLSKLGFGRYKNATVNEVLIREGHRDLISMYYKLGNISFADEILLQLGIYPQDRIEKPGKKPELYPEAVKRFWDFKNQGKSQIEILKEISHMKRVKRENSLSRQQKCIWSKGRLQAKNHGRL